MEYVDRGDTLPQPAGSSSRQIFSTLPVWAKQQCRKWWYVIPSVGARGAINTVYATQDEQEIPWGSELTCDYCKHENAHIYTAQAKEVGENTGRTIIHTIVIILCPQLFNKPDRRGGWTETHTYPDKLDRSPQKPGKTTLLEMRTTWKLLLREMLYYASLVTDSEVKAEREWYQIIGGLYKFKEGRDFRPQHSVIQSPDQCMSLEEWDNAWHGKANELGHQLSFAESTAIGSAENYAWFAIAYSLRLEGPDHQIWAQGQCANIPKPNDLEPDERPEHDASGDNADDEGTGGRGGEAGGVVGPSHGSDKGKRLASDRGEHDQGKKRQRLSDHYPPPGAGGGGGGGGGGGVVE